MALLPGLYRDEVRRYNYGESALLERFKTLATPHLQRHALTDWDWYFLAQHYGLPTRLLDWTENLLAATYFAICNSILCRDRLALDKQLGLGRGTPVFDDASPVVWVLDAGTVNRAACGEDFPFVPGGEFTSRYLPDAIAQIRVPDNELPLALLAPRSNERVAAQQGVFTIHGHSAEDFINLSMRSGIKLGCIILDRANVAFLWDELQLCGISKHAMFPSIESAAEHVKWISQAESIANR